MHSTSLDSKLQPTETLFDKIYRIAKTSEIHLVVSEVREILTQDTCLDIRNSQEETPAGKLAAEGNIEAVNELIKLGANINAIAQGAAYGGHREYAEWLRLNKGAGIHWIAQGAARGGHRDYAEWLRKYQGAYVDWIARGAAQGGQREYAEWLRIHHDAEVNWIAEGAAKGGYLEYAEWLLQNNNRLVNVIAKSAAQGGYLEYAESLRQHHGASVHSIAEGAAQGGHREYAESLRQHHGASVNSIASGAAWGGHREYAEWLRRNHNADVKHLIYSAAEGGHREYAEWLRQNHALFHNMQWPAEGAARGGHREYAEWLRNDNYICINTIIIGAAKGGHYDYLEYLYSSGCISFMRNTFKGWRLFSKYIGSGESIHYFKSQKRALQYLSFIKNDSYRLEIARILKKETSSFLPLLHYDVDKVVFLARLIQSNMQKYSLNYDQAFAWINPEIRTLFLHSSYLMTHKNLPEDIALSISLDLAPLTFQDAKGLMQVAKFMKVRQIIVTDIKNYYTHSRTAFNFFAGDSRAKNLMSLCSAANDIKTLTLIFDNAEKALTEPQTGKDKMYKEFLHHHVTKLSSFLSDSSSGRSASQRAEHKSMDDKRSDTTSTSSLELHSPVPSSTSSRQPSGEESSSSSTSRQAHGPTSSHFSSSSSS